MPDTIMTTEASVSPYTNRSIEIKNLAGALVKAQAEIEGAKKDTKAKITDTVTRTYADLASVWDAVRKPLTDNGLAVIQFPRTAGNGVEIETTLLHTSGEFMRDVLWVPCGKNDAQGLGSAITYGRRYALMAVVGVCPVDDDGAAAVASTGTAGGGGDLRPVPTHRNGVRQASANGARMAAEEPELVANAQGRMKGTNLPSANGSGKKTAAEKAKEWTDNAIQTLNLSGQTAETLGKFHKDNADKIEWLENNAPDQHERFIVAYDNAHEAVKGKVAA